MKAKQFRSALQTIERFHFQFTVVSQLSSSGGISEMYAKAARDLSNADSPAARVLVLNDIRSKLTARRPEREVFVTAFTNRFIFTNDVTREGKLVQYVLTSILRHSRPSTSRENLTIEHILSQDKLGADVPVDVVGSLGNLILVDEELNQKLGNKEFSAKKKLLEQEDGLRYDIGGVLHQESWGPDEVAARAQELAQLAYDHVWRLPM